MSLLLSEPDAALLEAARLARELALRLRHASDELVETETTRQALAAQADRHHELAARLEATIRARGLMPRVPDPEMTGLHGLADHLAGFLDDTGLTNLLRRFMHEQTTLRERLEAARSDRADDERSLREAVEVLDTQIGELQRLGG